MEKNITGIILAGGKNTRMGTNKAFLEISGVRLIDKILDVYRKLFAEIIIVTNDPLLYLEMTDVVVATDIYKGKGALGGIFTGLFYATNQYSFVTACDMPRLNANFIEYLTELSGNHDIIIPQTAEGSQPLHAVYSRSCLPAIKKVLLADRLKITGFYRDMRVLTVGDDQIKPFGSDRTLFQNLNTPRDVEAINKPTIKS